MPNLDFAELVPRRDTFTDADGRPHEFVSRADFGAVQMARFKRATVAIEAAMAKIADDPSDVAAAEAFETAVNSALGMLLPTLAPERLAALTLGQKNAIVGFWNVQQERPAGEAPAGQLAPA